MTQHDAECAYYAKHGTPWDVQANGLLPMEGSMRSLILRYAWLAVMRMLHKLCIASKPYDASAGKVIATPNLPKAEVLEAVDTLVNQIRRDGSAIDLMSVMEVIPDETMAR